MAVAPLALTTIDLAFAGIIAGAVVSIVGASMPWLIAKLNRQHERELAAAERLFQRRADVYAEALRYLNRDWLRVVRTHPIIGPQPDPPAPAPEEERIAMYGRLAAFGSQEVFEEAEEYSRTVVRFHYQASVYGAMRDEPGHGLAEVAQRMHEERDRAGEQLRALERRIRDELSTP